VCEWILLAGERYDGTGPGRLRGELIPIESRISRAACLCDRALTGAPAGPAPQRRRAAVDELGLVAGAELDPVVVAALAGALERVT
jgi:HD-GYP domain-containing protein (c-di-GMP phosphodiesterase class II)